MNDDIKKILFEGTDAQRKYLFSFSLETPKEEVVKKFRIWARFFYPKFFKSKDAPFHIEMLERLTGLYLGQTDEFLNIGFRGCSKTTYTKLLIAYLITNDTTHTKRFYKVLSEDIKNSKQIVTDIYNLLIQPRVLQLYPEMWSKTTNKREETMERFTTSTGIKVTSGSVGQEQRGQIQEESRPDFLWFDDIESRNTLRSAVKTRQIWDNMQEAISGLSKDGSTTYTCNYISERGNVHRLVERVKNTMIVPIWDKDKKPTWDRYTTQEIEIILQKTDDPEGEYLCLPSASKDVLFDRESVDKQIPKKPIKELAGLKIFHEYNPSHRIAGGADVALGVGLDSSTSVFLDFDTIPAQVVATYYNNEIKPSQFGDELARQGNIFGGCLLAPEKNNAGISTIDRLKQVYPMQRIYTTQRKTESIVYNQPTEFGWDCVDPEAKILNENLDWVQARTIKEGDVIVGSQEYSSKNPSGKDGVRKLKYTKVVKVKSFRAKKISVILKDGSITTVSDNHPFLVTKNSWSKAVWCRADELKEDYILYKMDTWERNKSFEAGRLSGLLCGEGNIQYGAKTSTGYKSGLNLLVAQSVGIISDELPILWEKVGFTPNRKYVRHKSADRAHHKTMTYTGIGKAINVIKALGVLQPIRLIEFFKNKNLIESVSIRSLYKVGVHSVTHIEEGEVVGIETDEHTLFVDGILSHNTNSLTKSKMLNDLSLAISDGLLEVNDEDLIRELRNYTRNDLMDREIDARLATKHFDLLVALCIVWQMKDFAVRASHVQEKNQIDMLWEKNNSSKPTFEYE